ncbi:restriction endonuclease subunit S [uncultured Amphritea sp.]|uniref:restriction endonuclease subunit S n=1 Tax=uncultured Amphritea sp. TaxID=981605 RepID=UPI0026298C4C|nr:restriction endonuclease subunit S [uncultured Amphritea sp.]
MGSKWPRYLFEDCMDAIIDYRGKTPKKTDSGIPLITAKIIKNGTIQQVNEFIAEADYDSWMRRGIPEPGDVVLTTEAPLGEVAQLDDRKIALAQRVITLRGKKGFLDNTFLKYLLISNDVQHQLDGRGTGTTVKGIKQSELRKLELQIPKYETQKNIAHILSALDNKIQLNRQTNQTLEQMAQALFKSWFVDFDPVIDNALAAGNPIPDELQARAQRRQQQLAKPDHQPLPDDVRQLFPSEFEETEALGWVPKGWEVKRVDGIMELAYGKALKKTDRIDGNVPVYGSGGINGYHNSSIVDGPGIVIGRKGTVGSLYWESSPFYPIDTVFFVKPRDDYSLSFCFMMLQILGLQDMNTDAAVPGLNRNNVYRLLFPVANAKLLQLFSSFMDSTIHKMTLKNNENNTLTKLRDTLLPKLISGELRLPESMLDSETNPLMDEVS